MDRATEEIICDLQAQVYVLSIALRALARTHHDPRVSLTAWRDAIEEAAGGPVVPAYARRSEYVTERCQAFAEDWTAELVEMAVPPHKT